MTDEKKEQSKPDPSNADASIKSDPGTTNTTDPQEHMKGALIFFDARCRRKIRG